MRLNKASLDKAKLDEDRIDLSKILLGQFLVKATETLSRFHKNLVKVSVLAESGQGLGKIWAEVVTLTARNCTRIDMRSRSGRV